MKKAEVIQTGNNKLWFYNMPGDITHFYNMIRSIYQGCLDQLVYRARETNEQFWTLET